MGKFKISQTYEREFNGGLTGFYCDQYVSGSTRYMIDFFNAESDNVKEVTFTQTHYPWKAGEPTSITKKWCLKGIDKFKDIDDADVMPYKNMGLYDEIYSSLSECNSIHGTAC